jgi:hypothetical protein
MNGKEVSRKACEMLGVNEAELKSGSRLGVVSKMLSRKQNQNST